MLAPELAEVEEVSPGPRRVDQPDGVDEPERVDASARNELGHQGADGEQVDLKKVCVYGMGQNDGKDCKLQITTWNDQGNTKQVLLVGSVK